MKNSGEKLSCIMRYHKENSIHIVGTSYLEKRKKEGRNLFKEIMAKKKRKRKKKKKERMANSIKSGERNGHPST